jgi:uncharacterized membrane protein YeaQ/YmgE (transglycosylase-associated protein family)
MCSCAAVLSPLVRSFEGENLMFPTMIGTVVIAGILGYLSEKYNFTHNGILQSIIICIGGAFLFYFVRLMFGFGFSSAGLNAIVSSIGALIIVPTRWRK